MLSLEQLWQSAELLPSLQQRLPELNRSRLEEIIANRKGIDLDLAEGIVTQIKTKWQGSKQGFNRRRFPTTGKIFGIK